MEPPGGVRKARGRVSEKFGEVLEGPWGSQWSQEGLGEIHEGSGGPGGFRQGWGGKGGEGSPQCVSRGGQKGLSEPMEPLTISQRFGEGRWGRGSMNEFGKVLKESGMGAEGGGGGVVPA